MGEVGIWVAIWFYRFKFLEEIKLYWLFHVSFGEIRFLKWHDVYNQFKFLVFGNIKNKKSFQACYDSSQYFFLKIK